MRVHVFKGQLGVYGVTEDPMGRNLPGEYAPWQAERTIALQPGQNGQIAVDDDKAIEDISKNGYRLGDAVGGNTTL